jgi:hypothetical protein
MPCSRLGLSLTSMTSVAGKRQNRNKINVGGLFMCPLVVGARHALMCHEATRLTVTEDIDRSCLPSMAT